ncbi:hypothetical protein ACH6CV_17385 [Bacillota bacterium Meth-B3]
MPNRKKTDDLLGLEWSSSTKSGLGTFQSVSVGGMGNIRQKAIRFPYYEMESREDGLCLIPCLDTDDFSAWENDSPLTGQELLAGLMNLYEAINKPGVSDKPYTELIAQWCSENIHPYNHKDILAEVETVNLSQAPTNEKEADPADVMEKLLRSVEDKRPLVTPERTHQITQERISRTAAFRVDDFLHDLHAICSAMGCYLAIDAIERDDDSVARSLYYDGKLFDTPSFFEHFRAPEGKPGMRIWLDSSVMFGYVGMFPPLQMKLEYEQNQGKLALKPFVNSIFDVCWYTLSCMSGLTGGEELARGSRHFIRCECCHQLITAYGQQRYCQHPSCQAYRNARKIENYRKKHAKEPSKGKE